jgi:hypothetical protein
MIFFFFLASINIIFFSFYIYLFKGEIGFVFIVMAKTHQHSQDHAICLSDIDPLTVYLNLNNCSFNSLEGLPSKMPELISFRCDNTPLTSLVGFPQLVPKLTYLTIKNSRIKYLYGLPRSLPNLKSIQIPHNELLSLTDFPTDLPKLSNINVANNVLTSLQGLPPVLYPRRRHSDNVDVSGNLLENLACIPSVQGRHESHSSSWEYHDSPRIYLKGNPFRSLHGIPREIYYSFLKYFDSPHGIVDTPTPPERFDRIPTSEGISIYFYELYEYPVHSFFLSHKGAALLDACLRESTPYWSEEIQYCEDAWGLEGAYNFGRINLPPREDLSSSWHRTHNLLFDYYQCSPFDLASQYLTHCISGNDMSEEAIDRLKFEGSINERQILEASLSKPQEDPVVQAIQDRLSLSLPNGRELLL